MTTVEHSFAAEADSETDASTRIKTIAQMLSAHSCALLQDQISKQAARLDASMRSAFEADSWEAVFCVLRVHRGDQASTRLRVAQQCIRNVQALLVS